jgi:hypothetical protein
MKPTTMAGSLLIIIGIIAFSYQGFTYTTTEKAVDLGPIQVTTEKEHTLPLPPLVGGICLVVGILLLLKKS